MYPLTRGSLMLSLSNNKKVVLCRSAVLATHCLFVGALVVEETPVALRV